MAFFLLALFALYMCPAAVTATLESHVPGCYRGCLRNTTDVRDDCDIRDTECVCTHDWITKAVICCLARDCEHKDWDFINKFIMATCRGKVTNVPLGTAISCYAAWSKEVETAAITIPPYTEEITTTNTDSPASTDFAKSTIIGIASPLTKTNDLLPAVASFNGASMFTGSCTSPKLALASASAQANLTAYPWMGCSQENHDCCAFSGYELMLLTICPHDYATTSSACCPSKWNIYTTDLGGQTPCYTSLDMGFAVMPTIADNATYITGLAFTMKYGLTTEEPSRLNNGALAGAIIGSIIGAVCLVGAVGYLVVHRKRNRGSRYTATNSCSGVSPSYQVVHSPQELPGSTFIHENHPAFNPSRLQQGLLSGS